MMSATEQTLTLLQNPEKLVGMLYISTGKALLAASEGASLTVTEKCAALYAGWEEQHLTLCANTTLLLCGFRCEQPEQTLERQLREHGRIRDCKNLPESTQILSRLEALSPILPRSPAVQPAAQLTEHLLGGGQPDEQEIPAYLRMVRRLIEIHYAEDLTLDSIAEQVGRSKFHLSRAFRDYYQMTPGAYLTSVRLSRAALLLASTDLPVKVIGKQVGLANSTYFTARFKKQYGQPPRVYRNIMKKSDAQKIPSER